MSEHEAGRLFEIEETASDVRIALSGRVDTERCAAIAGPLIERIQASGKPVVFDLNHVDFVASAFLRICIIAARTAGSGKVGLAHASPSIKKVFKIAGLEGHIVIE